MLQYQPSTLVVVNVFHVFLRRNHQPLAPRAAAAAAARRFASGASSSDLAYGRDSDSLEETWTQLTNINKLVQTYLYTMYKYSTQMY